MTGSTLRRVLATVGMVLGALSLTVGAPAPASAHTELIASTPESMSRLATPPEQLLLRFSEPVDPELATVLLTVHDQEARRVPTRLGDSPAVLLAEVPEGLADTGPWRVDYRVTSVDGHPVQGRLQFVVEQSASASSGGTPRPGSASGGFAESPDSTPTPGQEPGAALASEDSPAWLVLIIVVVMLSPVVAVLAWSLWRHRRRTAALDGGA